MNIGFFGTYFSELELILKNIAIVSQSKIRFFTDKRSNKILFDPSYILFDNIDETFEGLMNISGLHLEQKFECDFDRFQEFDHNIPQNYELEINAQEIKASFKKWYNNSKIDILICEGPHNFFNNVIISWLDENNIKYYAVRSGRIPHTTYIELNRMTLFNKKITKSSAHNEPVDYMARTHRNHRGVITKIMNIKNTDLSNDLKVICNNPIAVMRENNLSYHIPRLRLLLKTRKLYLTKEIRKKYVKKRFRYQKSESSKFLLYPEHYRPEASTSAYDYKYKDDIYNLLKIIPQLPADYKLIFRFHPSYFTRRPQKQFNFIIKLAIENKIRLSYPEDDLIDLLDQITGVITVSSSVAIDALKVNKKSIIVGNPEYFNALEKFGLSKQSIDNLTTEIFKSEQFQANVQDNIYRSLNQIYHPGSLLSGNWIHVIKDDFILRT